MTAALRYVTAGRARRNHALARLSTDLVTDKLAAAEAWVDQQTEREWDSKSRTEYHRGQGVGHFYLKCIPVTALTSITLTDDSGVDTVLTVSGATPDVTYDADTGRVEFGPDNTSGYAVFPESYQKNIAVVYTAGYASAAVPDDIQEAVILKALALYARSAAYLNAGMMSENIGGASQTRISQAELRALEESALDLLAPYKLLEV